jgi:hypothetical protein
MTKHSVVVKEQLLLDFALSGTSRKERMDGRVGTQLRKPSEATNDSLLGS